ncbi:MAG: glycosyltransferase family 4 protein [Treponema sp.]|nr:glycosyltransferase family 4 protein [Treponema sp.]
MKIAVDIRMSGKSGIGAFIDSMLPTFKESPNEIILVNPPIKPFSLKEALFFPRELLRQINACDAYFTPYCNMPGRVFSRGIKVPIFSTIHDVIFLDLPLAGKIGTLLRKIVYKLAIFKSKEIFTVSEFSKSRIIERLNCKKPISVVYSGVPLYNESPLKETEKTDTIIFVGNIKAHKGIKTLIPAFVKARNELQKNQKEKPPRLLIVGSKENFRTSDTELELLLADAQKDGIEFTGFVPDEKLKDLIAQARLLVQPSLYEGFGVPPLQALYSGTRAVISDIPVFKEIYQKLPVEYFKAGDPDDLAKKIVEQYSDKSPLPPVERIYSYKKSAQAVLKRIEESIKIKE